MRPYLESHGGNVQFLGIEGDVARVRLEGSCEGCLSSTMTLKLAIEEAIQKAAPELEGVEAEGVAEPSPKPATTIIAGPRLSRKKKRQGENGASSWTTVAGMPPSGGGMLAKDIEGDRVLFLRLASTLYAYRYACPCCGAPLSQGELNVADLTCLGCGSRFDARRAGRPLDDSPLYLEPIPLLDEDGLVMVALTGAVV